MIQYLPEITPEDLTFTDLNEPSFVFAPEEAPLTVRMTNVPVSFRKDAISDTGIFYDHEKNLSIEKS